MPELLKKGWTRVAFGDVVQLCRERSSDPAGDGFDRYVGLEHLDPGDLKIRRWGNIADGTTFTNVFRAGQVLFGKRRAYQRKVGVADFDGVCSGDIYVLKPKSDGLLQELLPFVCQTDGFFQHAVGTSAGSLSPRTNWESLASYQFALPPLEEQRRIATTLRAMEDYRQAVNKLEEEALQANKSVSRKLLLESKNCINASMRDVLSLNYGKGLNEKDRKPGKIPVYGSAGKVGEHSESLVPGPTIIIGRKGTVGSVFWSEESCWPIDTTYWVEANNNLPLQFVYLLLLDADMQRLSMQTAIPGLNRELVYKMQVLLPPKDRQLDIIDKMSKANHSLDLIHKRRIEIRLAMSKLTNTLLEV